MIKYHRRWVEPERYAPVETAARFEDWEFSYASVLGAAAAARYALTVGVDAIAASRAAVGLPVLSSTALRSIAVRADAGSSRSGDSAKKA